MTGRRNGLAVREAIEANHPEIRIKPPLTSQSGRWELISDDGTTFYDDFWLMVDYVAEHYDREPEADEPDTGEDQPHP